MKKLFVKFLIGLALVLVSGYSNLYAHEVNFAPAPAKNNDLATTASAYILNNLADATINPSAPVIYKLNDKVDISDNENEEEELSTLKAVSVKKTTAVSNYFTSAFYPTTPQYFCNDIKKCVPACPHFSLVGTQKLHIIFRVLRI
ncbi:hypothetical protein FMM05_01110 [Flavobacterium zepuense]|uniref:Uncharacterized protein n=1 Tax=Flavobacterium zepuense TaxID=2593302 RepID=A0A552V9V7_9FLAO|nr:hypothetical protein [Flavobacterium zepuense]TRW27267.1 hypothetical protein FMM05_01110 [Flavobacterium zepuense]